MTRWAGTRGWVSRIYLSLPVDSVAQVGTLAPSFGHIKSEKHEIAGAGGFVKFWTFSQKRALFHRLPLRARTSNGPVYTPGFSSGRKSTGSEFVLLKARPFEIVQNYGLFSSFN